MANASKCTICKKFFFPKCKCEIFPDKIPNEIFNESKECEYFAIEKVEDDDTLPLAKGR